MSGRALIQQPIRRHPEFCRLVAKPADPTRALATAAEDELDEALGELEEVLAGGEGRCAWTRPTTW